MSAAEGVSGTTAPAAVPRGYVFLGLAFCLTYAFAYADRDVMRLLYEPIRLSFRLTDTQATLLTGAPFGLVYTIAAIPLGRLVDRVHRVRLLVAAAATWSAGSILCGLSPHPAELVGARMAVALGEAALGPCVASLMADYLPQDVRGRMIGVVGAASVAGTSLAQIGGGRLLNFLSGPGGRGVPLLGDLPPWRAVILTVGLLSLIVVPFLLRLREPSRKERLTETAAVPSAAVPDKLLPYLRTHGRLIACLFGGYGLMIFANEAIFTWSPVYAIRHFHLPAGTVGADFGLVILLFGVSGPIVGGWISDRLIGAGRHDGRVAVGLTGLAGSALALTLPLVPDYHAYLAVAAVHAFSATFGAASAAVIIQDAFPNRLRGQGSAIYGFIIHFVAVNFAPLGVATISDYVLPGAGVLTAALCVAAPAMAAALVLLVMLRHILRAAP